MEILCDLYSIRSEHIFKEDLMTTKTRTKKVLSMLLSLVMMVSLCSVFCTTAFAVESDGEWNYTVDNGKATIISYSGTNTSITVPSSVGGYTVSAITGLCNNAYKSKITNITY